MSNQQVNQVAVDRREETVVTQQPGYAATEQVTPRCCGGAAAPNAQHTPPAAANRG